MVRPIKPGLALHRPKVRTECLIGKETFQTEVRSSKNVRVVPDVDRGVQELQLFGSEILRIFGSRPEAIQRRMENRPTILIRFTQSLSPQLAARCCIVSSFSPWGKSWSRVARFFFSYFKPCLHGRRSKSTFCRRHSALIVMQRVYQ